MMEGVTVLEMDELGIPAGTTAFGAWLMATSNDHVLELSSMQAM